VDVEAGDVELDRQREDQPDHEERDP